MTTDEATLREKRATVTRDHILGVAFDLLVEHPDQPFSHEAVAKAAGVGARTVYRYFPTQADLFEALWLQVREQSGTVFPTTEAEIVPLIGALFRAFDQNEKLVRAVMESPAGARVRARGAEEGRASFDQSLKEVMQGLSPAKRRQVRAVFQCIHSGPFWQMLRERGGLSGAEAIAAASWAAQALLDTLRREQKTSRIQTNDSKKQRHKQKGG
jgi:AcrR family transcriptional regulator